MAEPSRLLALPPELRQEVISYIRSTPDLKALCLTCKCLQEIASPLLYRDLEIPITFVNKRLRKSFNRSNPNMKHTRTLLILDGADKYNHAKHGAHIESLLRSFPVDSLCKFRLSTWAPVPLELSLLLRMRQRKLENVQILTQTTEQIFQVWFQAPDLQNTTTVEILLKTVKECKQGREILKHAPRLQELRILEVGPDPETLNLLFDPWQEQQPRRPKLRLSSLSLQNVTFALASPCLHRAIELESL
jgi:hypothetical protein